VLSTCWMSRSICSCLSMLLLCGVVKSLKSQSVLSPVKCRRAIIGSFRCVIGVWWRYG
jgi:hypothetical protein